MSLTPIPNRHTHEELTLLTITDLMRVLGLRRSSIYNLRQRPDFPKPLNITRKLSVWRAIDIKRWIDAQAEAVGYPPEPTPPSTEAAETAGGVE